MRSAQRLGFCADFKKPKTTTRAPLLPQARTHLSREFPGLRNLGNTCYLNACLFSQNRDCLFSQLYAHCIHCSSDHNTHTYVRATNMRSVFYVRCISSAPRTCLTSGHLQTPRSIPSLRHGRSGSHAFERTSSTMHTMRGLLLSTLSLRLLVKKTSCSGETQQNQTAPSSRLR